MSSAPPPPPPPLPAQPGGSRKDSEVFPQWARCVSCWEDKNGQLDQAFLLKTYGNRDIYPLLCGHFVCSKKCLEKCRRNVNSADQSKCPSCRIRFQESVILSRKTMRPLEGTGHVQPTTVKIPKRCDGCIRPHAVSERHCVACSLSLCNDCIEQHRAIPDTMDHYLIISPLSLYSVPHSEVCTTHKNHRLTSFCETCDVEACDVCVQETHLPHNVLQLDDYAAKAANDLRFMSLSHNKLLEACGKMHRQSKLLQEERDKEIEDIRKDLSEMFQKLLKAATQRHQDLQEDLLVGVTIRVFRLNLQNYCLTSLIKQCQHVAEFAGFFKDLTKQSRGRYTPFIHHVYSTFKAQVAHLKEKSDLMISQQFPTPHVNKDACQQVLDAIDQMGEFSFGPLPQQPETTTPPVEPAFSDYESIASPMSISARSTFTPPPSRQGFPSRRSLSSSMDVDYEFRNSPISTSTSTATPEPVVQPLPITAETTMRQNVAPENSEESEEEDANRAFLVDYSSDEHEFRRDIKTEPPEHIDQDRDEAPGDEEEDGTSSDPIIIKNEVEVDEFGNSIVHPVDTVPLVRHRVSRAKPKRSEAFKRRKLREAKKRISMAEAVHRVKTEPKEPSNDQETDTTESTTLISNDLVKLEANNQSKNLNIPKKLLNETQQQNVISKPATQTTGNGEMENFEDLPPMPSIYSEEESGDDDEEFIANFNPNPSPTPDGDDNEPQLDPETGLIVESRNAVETSIADLVLSVVEDKEESQPIFEPEVTVPSVEESAVILPTEPEQTVIVPIPPLPRPIAVNGKIITLNGPTLMSKENGHGENKISTTSPPNLVPKSTNATAPKKRPRNSSPSKPLEDHSFPKPPTTIPAPKKRARLPSSDQIFRAPTPPRKPTALPASVIVNTAKRSSGPLPPRPLLQRGSREGKKKFLDRASVEIQTEERNPVSIQEAAFGSVIEESGGNKTQVSVIKQVPVLEVAKVKTEPGIPQVSPGSRTKFSDKISDPPRLTAPKIPVNGLGRNSHDHETQKFTSASQIVAAEKKSMLANKTAVVIPNIHPVINPTPTAVPPLLRRGNLVDGITHMPRTDKELAQYMATLSPGGEYRIFPTERNCVVSTCNGSIAPATASTLEVINISTLPNDLEIRKLPIAGTSPPAQTPTQGGNGLVNKVVNGHETRPTVLCGLNGNTLETNKSPSDSGTLEITPADGKGKITKRKRVSGRDGDKDGDADYTPNNQRSIDKEMENCSERPLRDRKSVKRADGQVDSALIDEGPVDNPAWKEIFGQNNRRQSCDTPITKQEPDLSLNSDDEVPPPDFDMSSNPNTFPNGSPPETLKKKRGRKKKSGSKSTPRRKQGRPVDKASSGPKRSVGRPRGADWEKNWLSRQKYLQRRSNPNPLTPNQIVTQGSSNSMPNRVPRGQENLVQVKKRRGRPPKPKNTEVIIPPPYQPQPQASIILPEAPGATEHHGIYL